ncbi:hypothetical protein ACP4OV_008291 [Aristida adscensionis]
MDPAREPLSAAGGGLQRRPAAAARAAGAQEPPRGPRPIHADVDPPPRARPALQKLAIAAIVALGCLQFLPATHFRDPADPLRKWIAFDGSSKAADPLDEVGPVHIFSWINCLDLRTLVVLTNSTLSSSSDPQNITFHYLIPEGGDDKLPYHKLKVVLPDSNLAVTSQKKIKDKLNVATPEGNFLWTFQNELSPLLIATTKFSQKRYVYISADSITKYPGEKNLPSVPLFCTMMIFIVCLIVQAVAGKIEDLARTELGTYGIAAVEDCSKRLGDYVSMDVLNAIQRTGAKSWVSKNPYDKDACLLDLDLLLVQPHKLEKNLVDSIMWWVQVIDVANPRDKIRLAIALAFYDKYLKLPSNWSRANANSDILNYDGPKNVCSEDGRQHEQAGHGEIWQQYLHQKSEAILSA